MLSVYKRIIVNCKLKMMLNKMVVKYFKISTFAWINWRNIRLTSDGIPLNGKSTPLKRLNTNEKLFKKRNLKHRSYDSVVISTSEAIYIYCSPITDCLGKSRRLGYAEHITLTEKGKINMKWIWIQRSWVGTQTAVKNFEFKQEDWNLLQNE